MRDGCNCNVSILRTVSLRAIGMLNVCSVIAKMSSISTEQLEISFVGIVKWGYLLKMFNHRIKCLCMPTVSDFTFPIKL